jgi:hypothetical protein
MPEDTYPNRIPRQEKKEKKSWLFYLLQKKTNLDFMATGRFVWLRNPYWSRTWWVRSQSLSSLAVCYRILLGNPAPPCADRGCTDSCSTEGKAHWHNILRGSAKSPTSTGDSPFYLEIRERIYMEEEDHFTLSTPSS